MKGTLLDVRTEESTNALFRTRYLLECLRVHRLMTWIMAGQFLLGIAFAVFWSPYTWIGQHRGIHIHVWAAILIGLSLSGFAILWMRMFPRQSHTRHVVAVCQMLWSALLIHLSGGRIETHFHILASLAILSIYRDWKILITAAVVVAADHFLRGVYYPLSVFGVSVESPYRWLEHAAWVLFQVAFLAPACHRLRNEVRELCTRQTEIEAAKQTVDEQVERRTQQLQQAHDLLERKTVEAEKLALVARFTDNGVMITSASGRIEWVNSAFTRITGYTAEQVQGRRPFRFLRSIEEKRKNAQKLKQALRRQEGVDLETVSRRRDGTIYCAELEIVPVSSPAGHIEKYIAVIHDVTDRIVAEQERLRLHQELLDLSRQAGMAEIATGVLHNVGNILNSINVSASVIRSRLSRSPLTSLQRVSQLIHEYEDSFADFVRDDERGRRIPEYIQRVTESLKDERRQIEHEFQDLLKNVEHIKEIVSVQQSMATSSGLQQQLKISDLIQDALTANKASLRSHQISIEEDIAPDVPTFVGDKHRILQILINLIKNAKDAVKEAQVKNPRIRISATADEHRLIVRVADNGIGIPQEKLDEIFRHGFTTKVNGHGFGLHSSANAATEMGGELTARSDGPGTGAVFELTLPIDLRQTDEQRLETVSRKQPKPQNTAIEVGA